MSRRSKPSRWRVLIGVFDLIALLPWWLSIAAAIVSFGWLRHMAQSQVASPHPGLQELLLRVAYMDTARITSDLDE